MVGVLVPSLVTLQVTLAGGDACEIGRRESERARAGDARDPGSCAGDISNSVIDAQARSAGNTPMQGDVSVAEQSGRACGECKNLWRRDRGQQGAEKPR